MAKRADTKNQSDFTCGDCKHGYDYHEKGADGLPFLCKCEYREFSQFLSQRACKQFDHK